jgi:hypothetical protein
VNKNELSSSTYKRKSIKEEVYMMRRFVYTLLAGFIVVVCAFSFSGITFAAEFKADFIKKQHGIETKSKIYVKGEKMRMDMTKEGEKHSTIHRTDKKMIWIIHHGDKMYMEMPAMVETLQASKLDMDITKIADRKKVGTEKVNGYKCNKYLITYKDKSMGEMTQWISKKLDYPIKTVYHSSYGDMYTELKNIKEGGIKNSVFEIPKGYQKMSMPGMGGQMPRMPQQ